MCYSKKSLRVARENGDVGVVKDTAIHDIDIIRYLFGEEPIAVYAKTGSMTYKYFEV